MRCGGISGQGFGSSLSDERRRRHLNFLPRFGANNPTPSLPESAVAESTSWQAPAENDDDDGLEPFPAECHLPIYKQRDAVSSLLCPARGCAITPRAWRRTRCLQNPGAVILRDNRRETIWGGLDGAQRFLCPGASSLISSSPAACLLLSHFKPCGKGGTALSSLHGLSRSHSSDSLHCHSWK